MSYTLVGIDSNEWGSANNGLADVYFTREYYELNRHLHAGEPKCFIYSKDGYKTYYPFFLSNIPGTNYYDIEGAYGYNGVSGNNPDPEYRKAFHKEFADFCHESNIIAEFTRFHPLLENRGFSQQAMEISFNRKTVFLNLEQDYQEVWEKEYAVRTRNSIRKAQNLRVRILEMETPEAYAEFYTLYCETMKGLDAGSFYLWPEQYFLKLYDWDRTKRRLLFAFHDGKVIAGALFLIHPPFIHYHLSARKFNHSQIPSGQLLLDSAIQMAMKEDFKMMHFGGGASAAKDDGLLRFKQGFSREEAEFYIGKKIHDTKEYQRLISQWDEAHPEKATEMQGHFLRYRLR